MKKITKLSIVFTISVILAAVFAFSVNAAGNEFYVKSGSSGTGTSDKPFGTINQAISALGGKDGTIYIYDEYSISEFDYTSGWKGMITFAPANQNATLSMPDSKSAVFRGDTTIKNFKFSFGAGSHINSVGRKLITDFSEQSSINTIIHISGYSNSLCEKQEFIHQNGYVKHLFTGGAYASSPSSGVKGDIDVTVNGGHINTIYLCADTYIESQAPMSIGGNLNLVINGGTIDKITFIESKRNQIFGALNIVFNNGITLPATFSYPENAHGGTYIIMSANGGVVTPTDEIGVFEIKADSGKIAKINGNIVSDGKIKLDPGKTNVTWLDSSVSTDNAKILFVIDKTSALSNGKNVELDVSPVYVNGEVFVSARSLADTFAKDLCFDESTGEIIIKDFINTISLSLYDTNIYSNGVAKEMDVSAQIINGVTMIPVRYVAEAFGYNTAYNISTKTLAIKENTVYVKSGSNGNGTKESPFGNLDKAVEALSGNGGTVYIYDKYDISSFNYYPGWKGTITFAPANENSVLYIPNSRGAVFRGDAVIKGFNFDFGESTHINSVGARIVIDLGENGVYDNWVHIGPYGDAVLEKQEFVLESGYVEELFTGGAYSESGKTGIDGDNNIIINGGHIGTLQMNANIFGTTQIAMYISGNQNVIINGGTIDKVTFNNSKINDIFGALNFVFNNGTQVPQNFSYPQNAVGGTYIIKSQKGGMVTPEKEAGLFKLNPDAGKIAKINGKLVYDKVVKLSPGETEVLWVDAPVQNVVEEISFTVGKDTVNVNGIVMNIPSPAAYINGKVLVSAESVIKIFSADLALSQNSDTVEFKKYDTLIKFIQGDKHLYCNDAVKEIDVPLMTLDGKIMVPVQEIAEIFGYTVTYNHQNKTLYAVKNEVYVKEGGSGNGTKENPFGTLKEAIDALDNKGGTVYIFDEYNISLFDCSRWDGMITLAPANENATLTVAESKSAVFRGDITIKGFKFNFGQSTHINSVGAKLVMDLGENATFEHWVHLGIYGNGLVDKQEYVHQSGYTEAVYAGGAYTTSPESAVKGDNNLVINGGHIYYLYLNADTYAEDQMGMLIGGNLNVIVNGGVIEKLTYIEKKLNRINGALNIIFNNGVSVPKTFLYPQNALGGTFIIKSQKGGMITPTEKAGVFNVKAEKGKVAKINGKTVYDGTVTLSAGTTEVLWVDDSLSENVPTHTISSYSGVCGTNLIWTYKDGELIISGDGKMDNWISSGETPWRSLSKSIKTVTVKDGVTSVGVNAFADLPNLTNAVLADTVETIGHWAFARCEMLQDIDIPEGVTTIGEGAFSYCNSLTSVEIPDSVLILSENSFFYCENLMQVTIGRNLYSIEIGSFDGCKKLTGFTVDENNPYFSSDNGVLFNHDKTALVRCPEGKTGEYAIPSSVRYIERFAFYDCKQLTKVVVPEGVESIEWRSFAGCTALTDITLPETLEYIADEAFEGCSSLTKISIPRSVELIETSAFYNCDSVTIYGHLGSYAQEFANINFIPFSDVRKTTASGKCGQKLNWVLYDDGELVISGVGNITSTPWNAYTSSVKKVVIGNGVTSVPASAFSGYVNLKYAKIPQSVTTIGNNAFAGCANLTLYVYQQSAGETYAETNSIPYSDGKELLGYGECGENISWILYDSGELYISGSGKMTDWKNNTSVPWYRYHSLIKSVTFDGEITSIGDYAFAFCNNLYDITMPNSITEIGDYAFAYCNSFDDIQIPESVTEIGKYAFAYSINTTSIVIPEKTEKIGNYAFLYCTSIEIADVPESVTEIGNMTFAACDNVSIRGYDGSYAENYATGNNIPFIEIQKALPGDVTGDGKVNRMDLLRLGKYFSGWDVEIDETGSDVTGDGKVNRMDLLRLGKYFSGWDVTLG